MREKHHARNPSKLVTMSPVTRAPSAPTLSIDVWDGFVDEAGKYSNYGPDYEGQTRRLRSSDGVFFTKYGALKLAHYVERELQRFMSNRRPVEINMAHLSFGSLADKPTSPRDVRFPKAEVRASLPHGDLAKINKFGDSQFEQ